MEAIYVLIKSNFRDESEHVPIAVSQNKDWLIKKIPDEYEEMEDEFVPTFVGKHGDYLEIRQTEFLIKEPYEGVKLTTLTKKKFKELSSIHVYGRGQRRRVKLFIDWRNDYEAGAIGFKYCLTGYGVTKKQILDDAYAILVDKDTSSLMWYDYKEAQTEKDRFKVPLTA